MSEYTDPSVSDLLGVSKRVPCSRPAYWALAVKLRQDIGHGHWVGGQWLKQADLATHYGATRSEVRGALGEMLRQALVVHELNRGYRVASPDPVRRMEIRATRTALETAAADGIVTRATPADIERLRDMATQFEEMVGEAPFGELAAVNRDFHAALYGLSGNSFLSEMIADLRARGVAAIGRWTTTRGLVETAREHLAMVDAIAARDAETLRVLIRAHIAAF